MTEESRAEYWKAEHNAANEEIERLRSRIAELALILASAYGQWDVADADRQALKARVAELEAKNVRLKQEIHDQESAYADLVLKNL